MKPNSSWRLLLVNVLLALSVGSAFAQYQDYNESPPNVTPAPGRKAKVNHNDVHNMRKAMQHAKNHGHKVDVNQGMQNWGQQDGLPNDYWGNSNNDDDQGYWEPSENWQPYEYNGYQQQQNYGYEQQGGYGQQQQYGDNYGYEQQQQNNQYGQYEQEEQDEYAPEEYGNSAQNGYGNLQYENDNQQNGYGYSNGYGNQRNGYGNRQRKPKSKPKSRKPARGDDWAQQYQQFQQAGAAQEMGGAQSQTPSASGPAPPSASLQSSAGSSSQLTGSATGSVFPTPTGSVSSSGSRSAQTTGSASLSRSAQSAGSSFSVPSIGSPATTGSAGPTGSAQSSGSAQSTASAGSSGSAAAQPTATVPPQPRRQDAAPMRLFAVNKNNQKQHKARPMASVMPVAGVPPAPPSKSSNVTMIPPWEQGVQNNDFWQNIKMMKGRVDSVKENYGHKLVGQIQDIYRQNHMNSLQEMVKRSQDFEKNPYGITSSGTATGSYSTSATGY